MNIELTKNIKQMIRTRFPPEPNGYLHLGHVKSMYRNFGYASKNNGECILRMDDTNPDTEKLEYVENIIETVKWIGYKPSKITYTSDYFDKLYEYALLLINNSDAYVDDLSEEKISEYRRNGIESPNRNRSIKENLKLFDLMKMGIGNGQCLRAKMDLPECAHWNKMDLILYRNKNTAHYRHGNKYKIYPSYDFSHCIIDSLEGITHSFCTSEFYIRRPTYYWILDRLNLRKPIVEETNRLILEGGETSKRNIKKLIDEKLINGWDDPRLLTIMGMRNRGYNPDMLKLFMSKIGYTTNNDAIISRDIFDSCIREYLNNNASRCFCIFKPLKINIINVEDDLTIKRPNHPLFADKGERNIKIGRSIYIDNDDFRKDAGKKYFRLTNNKECYIRLKYFGIIKYLNHAEDEDGNILYINVEKVAERKVKGTIHWLYEYDNVIVKYFDKDIKLFNVIVEKNLAGDYYEFERIGYFFRKDDNTYHHLVSSKVNKCK
jgi:glutaminyl-tRNA synthetase